MKKISFSKFNKWAESHNNTLINEIAFFDAEEEFGEYGVQFHKGEITLDRLAIAPCVVIDGNLVVKEDFDPEFEVGLLVVNGNLHCDRFDFSFQTVITGNLVAKTIDVNSYYDYSMDIGGDLIADTVIERGHSIVVRGEIKAGKVYATHVVSDKHGDYTNLADWKELPEEETNVEKATSDKPYENVVVDGISFKVIPVTEAKKIICRLTDTQGEIVFGRHDDHIFPNDEDNCFFLVAENDVEAEGLELVYNNDAYSNIFVLGYIFKKNLVVKKFVEAYSAAKSPVLVVLGQLQAVNIRLFGNKHYIGNGVKCEMFFGYHNGYSCFSGVIAKGKTEAKLLYTDNLPLYFESINAEAVINSETGLKTLTGMELLTDDNTTIIANDYLPSTHKLSDIIKDNCLTVADNGVEFFNEEDLYNAIRQTHSLIDNTKQNRWSYSNFKKIIERDIATIYSSPQFAKNNSLEAEGTNEAINYFAYYFESEGVEYCQIAKNIIVDGKIVSTRLTWEKDKKEYELLLCYYDDKEEVKYSVGMNIDDDNLQARAVKRSLLETIAILKKHC